MKRRIICIFFMISLCIMLCSCQNLINDINKSLEKETNDNNSSNDNKAQNVTDVPVVASDIEDDADETKSDSNDNKDLSITDDAPVSISDIDDDAYETKADSNDNKDLSITDVPITVSDIDDDADETRSDNNDNKDLIITDVPDSVSNIEDDTDDINELDDEDAEKAKSEDIKVGDIIMFGSYEQDNDVVFGKEPIEWIVLSVENDKALLLSKYALDYVKYGKGSKLDWDDSYLRAWLNEDFFNNSFNEAEKDAIIESTIFTKGHPDEIETKDRIFVLSKSELCNKEYGFPEDEGYTSGIRCAIITDYAYYKMQTDNTVADVYKGLYTSKSLDDPMVRTCYYWVRETGKRNKKGRTAKVTSTDHVVVTSLGYITSGKTYTDCICVRPAMWIKIASL